MSFALVFRRLPFANQAWRHKQRRAVVATTSHQLFQLGSSNNNSQLYKTVSHFHHHFRQLHLSHHYLSTSNKNHDEQSHLNEIGSILSDTETSSSLTRGSEATQIEVDKLTDETNALLSKYKYDNLSSKETPQEMTKQLMNNLEKWHQITKSITIPPKHNYKRNRFAYLHNNDEDDMNHMIPLDTMNHLNDIKITCAQTMNEILSYHIRYNIIQSKNISSSSSDEKDITRPFSLVMEAWNQSPSSPDAGSKTASVLESWGQVYGGNMTLAPTIHQFNVVLDAYAKNSSGNYDHYTNIISNGNNNGYNNNDNNNGNNNDNNHHSSTGTDVNSFPAELAWDIYSFLSRLNDVTLLPNVTSCVHIIHALSHHAFVMKYASRDFSTTMDADIAAIRAFSVWKRMLELVEAESKHNENNDTASERLIWGAHNDIIGLSSHGMLRRDDTQHEINNNNSQENTLATVGQKTEGLFNQVLSNFSIDHNDTSNVNSIRQAYLSVMIAWIKEQEEMIARAYSNNDNIDDDDDDDKELMMTVIRGALSTEALLVKMKESDLKPSPEHYHAAIKAYHNCLDTKVLRSDKDGKIGEDLLPHISCLDLLDEMETNCLPEKDKKAKSISLSEKIDARLYADVINSFVRSTSLSGFSWVDIEKVEVVFSKMMDLCEHNLLWVDGNNNRQPMVSALNHLLRIYSQTEGRNDESLQRSSALLQRFKRIRNIKQHPNAATYTYYLTTLLRSNNNDAGRRAMNVLNEMEKNNIKPNIAIYTSAIQIIGKSRGKENFTSAKKLLMEAIKEYNHLPNDEQQNSGFNAAALYASFISAKMKSRMNDPVEANRFLKTLSKRYEESKDPNLKPDVILYGTVLDSLSRQIGRKRAKSGLLTSLQLLDKMESMFQQGQLDMLPTKQCYTSVLMTISKSGLDNAPAQAESILQRMEQMYEQTGDESVKPDHITYSALVHTLSRSKLPVNTNRAVELMTMMEEKARNSEISWPNASTYTALINIFKDSGKEDMGEKAEAVIYHMDENFAEINHSIKANTDIFNAALNTWASSNSPQKATKAWNLFNEMCNRYDNGDINCKPDIISFSLVLNACAYTKEKASHKDAVRIALQTQERLLKNVIVYGLPDSIFFNRLIKVFGFCISDLGEKERFISTAFERCAKEGHVNHTVLESVRRYTPRLYEKLPGMSRGKVSVQSLPKDWTKKSL